MVRVGLIGFGLAGQAFHAPVIRGVPGMELACILERHGSNAKQRYPEVRVARTLDEMLSDKTIGLCVVATPNDSHYSYTQACLEAGRDVVVDKPFTPTMAEAEQLVRLAADRGRLVTVYQDRRWDGAFLTVKKLVSSGALGTVAEYEPSKKLSVRTAGIRVATTYGALMVLGLAAWFAWIPVEHAASHEGASNLTLILDSALAITFVSSLESVAFGLIPMKFLDGNDLFSWHKGLWMGMWGAALLWFSIVILNPALSTYGEVSGSGAVWFVLLFSSLMVIALTTWGYFRVRDARLARAAQGGIH